MNPPLDESYLTWLYSQVDTVKLRRSSSTHWDLLRVLYTTEFMWSIPNDENRAKDGEDLRYEFLDDSDVQYIGEDWLALGCSMLELLVGLSRRLSFEAEGEPRDWFWKLIDNIGLSNCTDGAHIPEDYVREALNRVIWRQYDSRGNGGLFPLQHARDDQRSVELWYQLSAYVLELD